MPGRGARAAWLGTIEYGRGLTGEPEHGPRRAILPLTS